MQVEGEMGRGSRGDGCRFGFRFGEGWVLQFVLFVWVFKGFRRFEKGLLRSGFSFLACEVGKVVGVEVFFIGKQVILVGGGGENGVVGFRFLEQLWGREREIDRLD